MLNYNFLNNVSLRSAPAIIAATMLAFGGLTFQEAHAAGGGTTTTTTPKCKKNKVWDKNKLKCVPAKKSSNLSDDSIFETGRALAYAGRYDEAVSVLKLASNKNDPRILNFLGYSTRKLGNVESGLVYYYAAIKADPNYTLARSYMGEAYLMLGDRKNALKQLGEIGDRCGTGCAEYASLKKRIDGQPVTQTW